MEKKLLKLKEKVETAKRKSSEKKGELKNVLKQLQELNCKDVEAGKARKKKLKKEIDKQDKVIESNINKLEKLIKDEKK